MKKVTILFTLAICFLLACSGPKKANMNHSNETHVRLETNLGNITVKLYNETPLHRDNFIKLVKEGVYDSTLFHRVIKNFMCQAGDPDSKTASDTALLGEGDSGGQRRRQHQCCFHFCILSEYVEDQPARGDRRGNEEEPAVLRVRHILGDRAPEGVQAAAGEVANQATAERAVGVDDPR